MMISTLSAVKRLTTIEIVIAAKITEYAADGQTE